MSKRKKFNKIRRKYQINITEICPDNISPEDKILINTRRHTGEKSAHVWFEKYLINCALSNTVVSAAGSTFNFPLNSLILLNPLESIHFSI